jgi:putative SOS response-associated peptidase YedK
VFTSQGPRLMNWGLTVNWSTKPLINARCETLKQKKNFQFPPESPLPNSSKCLF